MCGVQWRLAYLVSVAMSLQDDSCKSLIDSVEYVFKRCIMNKPARKNFASTRDFDVHAERFWDDLRYTARSRSRCSSCQTA